MLSCSTPTRQLDVSHRQEGLLNTHTGIHHGLGLRALQSGREKEKERRRARDPGPRGQRARQRRVRTVQDTAHEQPGQHQSQAVHQRMRQPRHERRGAHGKRGPPRQARRLPAQGLLPPGAAHARASACRQRGWSRRRRPGGHRHSRGAARQGPAAASHRLCRGHRSVRAPRCLAARRRRPHAGLDGRAASVVATNARRATSTRL